MSTETRKEAACPERRDGGPHTWSRKPGFGNLVTCDDCGTIDDAASSEPEKKEP